VVIHQIASDENQQKSFYRLLHNKRMEIEALKEHIYQDCYRQIDATGHYLVIQDTTQPNFNRNKANISNTEGLGVIADKRSLGFFLHPSLVVDAQSGRCVGFSDIHTWSRCWDMPTKTARNYHKLPIEEKESHRWLRATRASVEGLQQAAQVTIMADREGDIIEMFDRRQTEHLLIRSRGNRTIVEGKLYEYLSAQDLAGSFELTIKGDTRKAIQPRKATIQIRYTRVHLRAKNPASAAIEVYAIEAREVNNTLAQETVLWRLLTTHQVDSVQKARQIIDWYSMRWNIEQVFRIIKQKGLDVENSDLETGKALIIMTLMALFAASKIMLLHLASKQEHIQPIGTTFSEDQLKCLKIISQDYEGNTLRQQNRYPPNSLQWVYWVIARLGGWKPQEKQAGVITLFTGWSRFQQIYQGWILARKFVS